MNAGTIAELQLLIGGEWREGRGVEIVSRNPSNPNEIVARGIGAASSDVEDAIRAAAASSETWRRTPHHERCAILRRAARLLESRANAYGAELTREEGKCLAEGIGEVRRAAQILEYCGNDADRSAGEIYASPRDNESILVTRHPLGVVGIITPFNFPIAIPAWKIGPALSYGNAVVWKPASDVPLLAQRLSEVLVEAGLPSGVLNLVAGPGPVGQSITEHQLVSGVSFTGSTFVGRMLIAECGRLAKPIQAEMGGKNASIVLADADIDIAINAVMDGAFRAAGQRCTATSRLIVQSEIAGAFIDELVRRVNAIVLGDPMEVNTHMGPLVSRSACEAVTNALANTVSTSRLLTETHDVDIAKEGYFVRPAILEIIDTTDSLWRDEIFGPVLTVVRANSIQDAFNLANDSDFGLSCALFTNDMAATIRAMDELEVGSLHVNSETGGADPHVPFGGSKGSGFGPKEQGRAAREFYTTRRTVYLRSIG